MRGPLVVMAGVLLFSETVTGIEFAGYTVALVGFVWFQFAKAQQVRLSAVQESVGYWAAVCARPVGVQYVKLWAG